MSEGLATLDAFEARWRKPLARCAQVIFKVQKRDTAAGTPVQIADAFVVEHGFTPIGFDWELLDADAAPGEARSALGAFRDALALDLMMRDTWLGDEQALDCGREFVGAFNPSQRLLLTNHIIRDAGTSEGWNPISKAAYEWAFLGLDDSKIALLLITAED